MSDELLPYYNRELDFFRQMARGFASRHPKIAGRLKLGPDASQDPHVERLIEAFAFLNARTRHKIEDDFPEISDAFLNTLYPHYLSPIPSMAIVEFHPDEGQAEVYHLPSHQELETEPVDGEPCRFRTAYSTDIWPLELSRAALTRQPVAAPTTPHSGRATAVLRWRLQTLNEATFEDLEINKLRFYLHGPSQYTFHLYELLRNNTLEIAVAHSPDDPEPLVLPATVIQPVGFGSDEGMLPYPAQSNLAYRLLSEFFFFPEKFLFLDLELPAADTLARYPSSLDVYFYLNRTSPDLEQNVDAEMFRFGAAPIVNLFRQRAEPVTTNGASIEYRIEPDARRPMALEVYSVDHVVATEPDGETEHNAMPLYSIRHGEPGHEGLFYHEVRRPTLEEDGDESGSDMYLSLVDLSSTPRGEAGHYIDIETTCFNRDLPNRLPFGGGQPELSLSLGGAVGRIECLTPPTPTRRPPQRRGAIWRLISHLTLGHLPLEGGEDGATALREILQLYNLTTSSESESVIELLSHVETRRSVARVSGGVCRGTEARLQFEPRLYSEKGLYLFTCVLDHYLGQHTTLNSFTQLTVLIEGWDAPLVKWPARAGNRVLA